PAMSALRPVRVPFGMNDSWRIVAIALLAGVAPAAAQASPGAVLPTAFAPEPHYSGNCPARVEFDGHVTTTVNGIRIDYRWERSNGDSGKLLHATLNGIPTDSTHHTFVASVPPDFWRLALPGQSAIFSDVLHIVAPFDIRSAPAKVLVECKD